MQTYALAHNPTIALARSVLEHADQYTWTTMGFGMVRTYLDDDKQWRLNIWDDRLQVPHVSTIHDHPWSFTSFICAGCLNNRRYTLADYAADVTHLYHRIKTGEGGGPVEEPLRAHLVPRPVHIWRPGSSYSQELDEIHETTYSRGTVTLNDRTPPTKAYTARVFWPVGTEWVDAMPRPATREEWDSAVSAALEHWNYADLMAPAALHHDHPKTA